MSPKSMLAPQSMLAPKSMLAPEEVRSGQVAPQQRVSGGDLVVDEGVGGGEVGGAQQTGSWSRGEELGRVRSGRGAPELGTRRGQLLGVPLQQVTSKLLF